MTVDLFQDLEDMIRSGSAAGSGWTGTFGNYLQIVLDQPSVADLSHTRMYKAVVSRGIERTTDGKPPRYAFFQRDIYGLEHTIEEIMEYLRSAAEGLDTKRRMLLLMGPVGSAKSTAVALLKRGLEDYTRTDAGALYGIADCPLHEEPLHLLDDVARRRLRENGIMVEGSLCPVCEWRREHDWQDVMSVPVERVFVSEGRRIGIGSFTPGDPKVVSLEDLVGGLDLVKVSEYGSEAHPLAWDFRGSMEVASRGMMEFVEVMKADNSLLLPLITLIQERQIKAGRFALFYSDEAVVAHTNISEYEKFAADPKNEAIQNRTYVVKVPYVLQIDDEMRIYQKLFDESTAQTHLAPHTLRLAAVWAVMSRLLDVTNVTPLAKAKLYNSEEMAEHTPQEIDEWHRSGREGHTSEGKSIMPEGMFGIGPRPIISALSQARARTTVGCLNPLDAVRALRDVPQHIVGPYDAEKYTKLLKEALNDYTERAQKDVQKAFVEEFDSAAQTLLMNYMDNAQAFLSQQKVRDPITGDVLPPDEKLMQSIESYAHVTETTKKEFRQEILTRVGILTRNNQTFRWDSHPRLKEAIEKKLFSDLSGTLKVTITTRTPDQEQRKKIEGVKQRLIDDYGYCEHCSSAVLQFVGHTMNR